MQDFVNSEDDDVAYFNKITFVFRMLTLFPKHLLTVLVALSLCSAVETVAKAGETGVMPGMTAAHNRIRSQLGIAPLVWSDELAEFAQNRAIQLAENNNCQLRHEPSGQYGENLYWASAVRWSNGKREIQDISAQHVAETWEQEARDYDHRAKRCRKGAACGHYTQMIWRDSKEIGCGMVICADKGQVWVCNYSPPGNFIGQSPY